THAWVCGGGTYDHSSPEPGDPGAGGAGVRRRGRDDPGPDEAGSVHLRHGPPAARANCPRPRRPGTAGPPHRQQILRPPTAVPLRAHAGPLRREPDAEHAVRLAGAERRAAAAALGTAARPGAPVARDPDR